MNDEVKKEVMLKSETALGDVPMSMEEMIQDAKLGGKVGLVDIGIPFLYILQTNSPQTNEDHPKYIKGARAGMFYITVLEQVFDGREVGLIVTPCFYERLMVEWVPREAGGGLIGSYDPNDPIVNTANMKTTDEGRNVLALLNGHHLVDTAYWYCLVKIGNTWKQCVMPFKSTFLKVSRKWNSQLQTTFIPGSERQAPRWLYKYNLKTIKEQRDDYLWSVPVVSQDEVVSTQLYAMAKEYAQIAAKGILRKKVMEGEGKAASVNDTDVPF